MRNRWYFSDIGSVLCKRPNAVAIIKGSNSYSEIKGRVLFHQMNNEVLVRAEIVCLSASLDSYTEPIFAFHIHEGKTCGSPCGDEPFKDAGAHFNPCDCPHPYHKGDLPPLFGANGKAFSMFLTDRFKVADIIGKTVVIHKNPDDFTTQPSGNSGERIACGVIMPLIRAN